MEMRANDVMTQTQRLGHHDHLTCAVRRLDTRSSNYANKKVLTRNLPFYTKTHILNYDKCPEK